MERKIILNSIEEMLELDEGQLNGTEELQSIDEWDSMAAVYFLAMADEKFNKTIFASALRNCKTVDDLVNLLINQ